MGASESDLVDGPTASSDTSAGTAGDQPRVSRTTRTHLLCLSRAHNKFSIQLYQEFAKDGKRPGNFVICPVSVSIGLGMLHLGAHGPSQDELHKALHLHEVQEQQLLPAFAAMHWDLTRSVQPKGCVLEVAIRLFAQAGHFMTQRYERICNKYEIARLKNADFRNRPDLARKEINQWTEERTHGRIKDAVPMGIIDRDTSVLMLCATYAKLQFLHPFDKRKTNNTPFYSTDSPQVQMMYQRHVFRLAHYQKLDCDVLELPLSSTHSKLLLILPKKMDGVGKLEMKLSRTVLESIMEKLVDELVDVYLPRFRYELGIICWDALVKLGVKNLYQSGKADFSGLDGTNNLFLSRAFHHVCLEIDEGASSDGGSSSGGGGLDRGGSSSLASNNTVCTTADDSSVLQVPKVFRADHPFLFFVIDERTGAILFIGRVYRPSQTSVT